MFPWMQLLRKKASPKWGQFCLCDPLYIQSMVWPSFWHLRPKKTKLLSCHPPVSTWSSPWIYSDLVIIIYKKVFIAVIFLRPTHRHQLTPLTGNKNESEVFNKQLNKIWFFIIMLRNSVNSVLDVNCKWKNFTSQNHVRIEETRNQFSRKYFL